MIQGPRLGRVQVDHCSAKLKSRLLHSVLILVSRDPSHSSGQQRCRRRSGASRMEGGVAGAMDAWRGLSREREVGSELEGEAVVQ